MIHMLKIDALLLLFVATSYLVVMFTSASDDGILLLPIVVVSIVVSIGLLEIDRRLKAIEQSKPDTDHKSHVE